LKHGGQAISAFLVFSSLSGIPLIVLTLFVWPLKRFPQTERMIVPCGLVFIFFTFFPWAIWAASSHPRLSDVYPTDSIGLGWCWMLSIFGWFFSLGGAFAAYLMRREEVNAGYAEYSENEAAAASYGTTYQNAEYAYT
jgi:hypothetical protein